MRQFSTKQAQPVQADAVTPASSRRVTPKPRSASAHDPSRAAAHPAGFDFSRVAVHGRTPMQLQAKLMIGAPADAFEQEADRVAERVMRMPQPVTKSPAEAGLSERPIAPPRQVQTKSLHAADVGGLAAPPIVHDVLRSPGQPLDAATRAFMEPRFGHDFSKVRVHADTKAGEAAASVHARAFTVNRDIVFGESEYAPDTARGRHLLAHELTHAKQQSDGPHPATVQRRIDDPSRAKADAYGQTSSDVSRTLICDLTSPVRRGSTGHFEIAQTGAEIGPQGATETYRWKVFDVGQKTYISEKLTKSRVLDLSYGAAGDFRIEATVLIDGNEFTTLKLEQTVVAEDAFLTTQAAGLEDAPAYREMVNDFSSYITDAAQSTGDKGITPRMLASVLKVEITNRPKEGRTSEVSNMKERYETLLSGGWLIAELTRTNFTVGVGQIRPSTAAMVIGKTAWVDQPVNDKSAGRAQSESNFKKLPLGEKYDVFERLRWPKSNIKMAAALLSKLKNRSNRFPAMSRADFAANQHGVEVVGTEYNLGATDSPAQDATPTEYGEWVWAGMSFDPIIRRYFKNE